MFKLRFDWYINLVGVIEISLHSSLLRKVINIKNSWLRNVTGQKNLWTICAEAMISLSGQTEAKLAKFTVSKII